MRKPILLTLIVAMAVGGTPAAWAHAGRVAADPSPDATVNTGPARVTATFSRLSPPSTLSGPKR